MKMRTFETLLEISDDGEVKMYNKEQWLKFIGQFGPGRRFLLETRVIEQGEKAWIRRYYFAEPVFRFMMAWEERGEIMDKNEAHQRMKKLYPPLRIQNENPKSREVKTRSIMDETFTIQDFWNYIEFLKQYAAEHFGIYIYDPREQRS